MIKKFQNLAQDERWRRA